MAAAAEVSRNASMCDEDWMGAWRAGCCCCCCCGLATHCTRQAPLLRDVPRGTRLALERLRFIALSCIFPKSTVAVNVSIKKCSQMRTLW